MGNFFQLFSGDQSSSEDESDSQSSHASQKSVFSSDEWPIAETTPQPENQPQAEEIVVLSVTAPDHVAADETVSPPLELSSLQNALQSNDGEAETSKAGDKQDERLAEGGSHVTKPSPSIPTHDGTSENDSSSSYLKKMSRQERRKIEHDIKRNRRPGEWSLLPSFHLKVHECAM